MNTVRRFKPGACVVYAGSHWIITRDHGERNINSTQYEPEYALRSLEDHDETTVAGQSQLTEYPEYPTKPMPLKKFITIIDRATFQVDEIQAVTVNNADGPKIRIYIKGHHAPFEYELPDASAAEAAFDEITRNLQ